jgi:tetratricopeptide (TPR) repeat protein
VGVPARAEPTDLGSLRQRLDALVGKGDLEGAIRVAQTVVARVTALHGPDHLETARSLSIEANLHAAIGSHLEALRLYTRALAIRESQLGPHDPSVADVLVASAEILTVGARLGDAVPLLQRAITIREDKLGPNHPDTADALNRLGVCLFAKAEYNEAAMFFERCLVIQEKTLGPMHPDTAQALTNLSSVYRERENYEKAKMLVARAYAIRSEAFGKEHEWTVDSVDDMGLIRLLEGNYEGAEKCFGRVLEFRRSHFGDDDPQVPRTANLLIAAYRAQGKEAEAAALESEFDSVKGDAAATPEDAVEEIIEK